VGRLIATGELASFMQKPVRADAERIAIRVAEGWVKSKATRLTDWTDWPDPIPEDLWAWAIELASIAYSNPTGIATRTVGDETTGFVIARRAEILDAIEQAYGGAQPSYQFPPAPCWP